MILAIAGGKGGVGKSTVALTLGSLLDGVVVDADLGMADLPTGRGPDLHDVLAGRATPMEAVCRVSDTALVPCGRTLAGARASSPDALTDTLNAINQQAGPVVVDCPAGRAADVGLSLQAADRCLLVTTPDRLAVPDALRTRALARVLDTGIERVVLNKVGDDPPVDRVRQIFGTPVTSIPASAAVQRATATGQPVPTVAPTSTVTARFRTLAESLKHGSAVGDTNRGDDGSVRRDGKR